jgi:hypothetical protein
LPVPTISQVNTVSTAEQTDELKQIPVASSFTPYNGQGNAFKTTPVPAILTQSTMLPLATEINTSLVLPPIHSNKNVSYDDTASHESFEKLLLELDTYLPTEYQHVSSAADNGSTFNFIPIPSHSSHAP